MSVEIRSAHAGEADALSALALRSKAHWGYDEAFMQACVAALTVSEEAIADGRVIVAQADGKILGVASLELDGATADVGHLFVEPEHMGKGCGRRLFAALVELAKARGATRLTILADPGAAPFYERMGAAFKEMAPSDAIPGRELPFHILDLRSA